MMKVMLMFKKLRNSMMMFNILTVSLVMLTAFTIIFLVISGNVERENHQRLQSVSAMFFMPNRTLPDGVEDTNVMLPPVDGRFSVEYGVSFVLFVKDGELKNVNSQLDLADEVYALAYEMVGTAQSGKTTLEGRTWLYEVAETPPGIGGFPNPLEGLDYTRIVFLDITNSIKILRTLLMTLGGVGIAVLLALFWISYRFAIRAVQPIEENYNSQKQFIADASHELRTPLAVIGANVDAITASGEETVDSQKEWFGYIRSELKRTGKLVDDLLYLAKSEIIRSEGSLPFDFSVVCETACASMEAVLYDSGKSMQTDIEKGVTVIADREKITGLLYIMLDNAGKYTPKGGIITVTLVSENDKAVLRVLNSGEGIPAEDLPKIFDRFYRSDASRSTETGGSGLGLSIAKAIVENSGGTISAESANGATTFTVRLRLSKNGTH